MIENGLFIGVGCFGAIIAVSLVVLLLASRTAGGLKSTLFGWLDKK